jgi:hypothetical protein
MAITLTCGWITVTAKIEFLKMLGSMVVNMEPLTGAENQHMILALQADQFLASFIHSDELPGNWIKVTMAKPFTEADEAKYLLSGPKDYYI